MYHIKPELQDNPSVSIMKGLNLYKTNFVIIVSKQLS